MLIPTLVFWLGAGIRIVALLIAVIIRDFIYISVLVLLHFLLLNLSCVGSACRGLLLLIPPFRISLSFLFLAGLFQRLACLDRPGRGGFYFFYLRLLLVKVLGSCPLGLHLRGGAIGRAVTLETADIRVSDHGARS